MKSLVLDSLQNTYETAFASPPPQTLHRLNYLWTFWNSNTNWFRSTLIRSHRSSMNHTQFWTNRNACFVNSTNKQAGSLDDVTDKSDHDEPKLSFKVELPIEFSWKVIQIWFAFGISLFSVHAESINESHRAHYWMCDWIAFSTSKFTSNTISRDDFFYQLRFVVANFLVKQLRLLSKRRC